MSRVNLLETILGLAPRTRRKRECRAFAEQYAFSYRRIAPGPGAPSPVPFLLPYGQTRHSALGWANLLEGTWEGVAFTVYDYERVVRVGYDYGRAIGLGSQFQTPSEIYHHSCAVAALPQEYPWLLICSTAQLEHRFPASYTEHPYARALSLTTEGPGILDLFPDRGDRAEALVPGIPGVDELSQDEQTRVFSADRLYAGRVLEAVRSFLSGTDNNRTSIEILGGQLLGTTRRLRMDELPVFLSTVVQVRQRVVSAFGTVG